MIIHMGIPQVIITFLYLLGLTLCIKDHKKPRTPQNAWYSLVATAVVFALLIWGGFYS